MPASRLSRIAIVLLLGVGLIFVTREVAAEVVIREIMYNPAGSDADSTAVPPYDREWVELYNTGASAVSLAGWQFGDAQDNTYASAFPSGTSIGPGQALVVTGDATTFDAQWGAGINRVQVNGFPSLANDPSPTNETSALRDNTGVIRDFLNFDQANGWPKVTGTVGASIFAMPGGLTCTANNVGTNWKPSMWGVYGGRYEEDASGSNHASPGFVQTVAQSPFTPSPDAAWSMVVMPDTQNYVKSSADKPILTQMTHWIRDHRDQWKIQCVLQEGDIVNQNWAGTPTSGDQTATQQWQNARNAFSVLNG